MPDDPQLAGAEGPGERRGGLFIPPRLVPLVAAAIGGGFILLNGWFAYVASTSNSLLQANTQALRTELQDVKNRLDRLDERLTHLEQLRMSAMERDRLSGDVAETGQPEAPPG